MLNYQGMYIASYQSSSEITFRYFHYSSVRCWISMLQDSTTQRILHSVTSLCLTVWGSDCASWPASHSLPAVYGFHCKTLHTTDLVYSRSPQPALRSVCTFWISCQLPSTRHPSTWASFSSPSRCLRPRTCESLSSVQQVASNACTPAIVSTYSDCSCQFLPVKP